MPRRPPRRSGHFDLPQVRPVVLTIIRLALSPTLRSGEGGREADGGGVAPTRPPQRPLHPAARGPPPPLRRGGEDGARRSGPFDPPRSDRSL
jgi:hypothetical protein